MADYQNVSSEDLMKRHAEIEAQMAQLRAVKKALSDELAFRDNLAVRAKALEGLSAADIARIQKLSGAGNIASGEKVVGTTTK